MGASAMLCTAWVVATRPAASRKAVSGRMRATDPKNRHLFEVRARRGFRLMQGQPFTLRLVAYAKEAGDEVGLAPALTAQGDRSWPVSVAGMPPPEPP